MSPWCVLLLSLTLPEALQGQDPTPRPHMANFQSEQFQGQWFVLGLASNTYRREDRALLNSFSTTYQLNKKGHFEVSNAMTRGKRCDTWSYVLTPAAQPGHFTVDTKEPGTFSEDVQVVDSDYTASALLLSVRRSGGQAIIRISLLGRNWNLPLGTLRRFACLVQAQGLTRDNIAFPAALGNGGKGAGRLGACSTLRHIPGPPSWHPSLPPQATCLLPSLASLLGFAHWFSLISVLLSLTPADQLPEPAC
ncbi:epididymal-specific lipocalin-12 isoform X5 [Sciurus carolinensis]|uniref:epididymal-specific lipocalin-12 isoform X5 n=1 Tax=Sciurus carolinensis TaxID=30640 RepID=UPI001FB22EEF|nr:epididymal-specific lipocalin-12 isoform X5 [Sciurus carolinensis]